MAINLNLNIAVTFSKYDSVIHFISTCRRENHLKKKKKTALSFGNLLKNFVK